MSNNKASIEALKKKLLGVKKLPPRLKGLSLGSTMLNLACSGDPDLGLVPGYYNLIVGDSQAGKSWLGVQALAEACLDSAYDKYTLIYDNTEGRGDLMDFERYYGKVLLKRMISPHQNGPSKSLGDFYDNVQRFCSQGPCIYLLDSEDPLEAADAKAQGYKTEKARMNSERLGVVVNRFVKPSNSILLIIKQTRQNIGPKAVFNPKTRSGGQALTFYANLELWFSVKSKLKKKVLGKDRTIGQLLRIQVKKNSTAGLDWDVVLPFRKRYGFDELASCIYFLVDEGVWTGKEKIVTAPEFSFKGDTEKLIHQIQNNNEEPKLRQLVVERWREVEKACSVNRKTRYQ
jgi:hypothetical protein